MKTYLKTLFLLGVVTTLVGCGGKKAEDEPVVPPAPIQEDDDMFEVDLFTIQGAAMDAVYLLDAGLSPLPEKFALTTTETTTETIKGNTRNFYSNNIVTVDLDYDLSKKAFDYVMISTEYIEKNSSVDTDSRDYCHLGGFVDDEGIKIYQVTEGGFGAYGYAMSREDMNTVIVNPASPFSSEEELVHSMFSSMLMSEISSYFGFDYLEDFGTSTYFNFLLDHGVDIDENFESSFKLGEGGCFKFNVSQDVDYDSWVDYGPNAYFEGNAKFDMGIEWIDNFPNFEKHIDKEGQYFDYISSGENYISKEDFSIKYSSEVEIEEIDTSLFVEMPIF